MDTINFDVMMTSFDLLLENQFFARTRPMLHDYLLDQKEIASLYIRWIDPTNVHVLAQKLMELDQKREVIQYHWENGLLDLTDDEIISTAEYKCFERITIS